MSGCSTAIRITTIFYILLMLAGCAAGNVLYTKVDFCDKPVNADMARIKLERHTGMGGHGVAFDIIDSGQPIGKVGNGAQLCWDRYPGNAIIRSYGHGAIVVNAVAGSVYEVEMTAGWADFEFELVKNDTYNNKPDLPLSAVEVIATFSGKTANWIHHKKGYTATGYFDPNGTLKGLKNGNKPFNRKWSVNEEGELCIHKEDKKSCRIIERFGIEYKKIKVKSNGNREHIVTYRDFVDGSPNNF